MPWEVNFSRKTMEIVTKAKKISKLELIEMSGKMYGGLVKGVVDIEKEIMAVDAELHADLEALLLEKESKQDVLWGINLYPEESDENFLEFDSMINIRPRQGNKSRGVEDIEIQKRIRDIVSKLVV